MATGTGLFDPNTCDWDDELLELCHVSRERLAAIRDEPVDWRGVPWFPAIGDGAASNLGCGATRAGLGAINVGTSAALRVMRSGASVSAPFGLFAYRVDRRRHLVGGAVSNAGNLHAWCMKTLQVPSGAAVLEREMASRPLPRHGLTVLPYWTAERAPTWNEDDRGVIHGLTLATSPLDILQAVTEGFYFRMAEIAERIPGRTTWIVSGGVLKSPSALARMASVFGASLVPSCEPEASLRGAAVYALEKLGASLPPLDHGEPVRANAAAQAAYRAERVRQQALEKALNK
jgi:gluconokinase